MKYYIPDDEKIVCDVLQSKLLLGRMCAEATTVILPVLPALFLCTYLLKLPFQG